MVSHFWDIPYTCPPDCYLRTFSQASKACVAPQFHQRLSQGLSKSPGPTTPVLVISTHRHLRCGWCVKSASPWLALTLLLPSRLGLWWIPGQRLTLGFAVHLTVSRVHLWQLCAVWLCRPVFGVKGPSGGCAVRHILSSLKGVCILPATAPLCASHCGPGHES